MYEACHGTASDAWHAHQRGSATRINPLGLAEALLAAMEDAERVEHTEAGAAAEAPPNGLRSQPGAPVQGVERPVAAFVRTVRQALHEQLAQSCLCRASPVLGHDTAVRCAACGKCAWTTDSLIQAVATRLHHRD